jgi:hypothetical protein
MPRENRVRSIYETPLNRDWNRTIRMSEKEGVKGHLISKGGHTNGKPQI